MYASLAIMHMNKFSSGPTSWVYCLGILHFFQNSPLIFVKEKHFLATSTCIIVLKKPLKIIAQSICLSLLYLLPLSF